MRQFDPVLDKLMMEAALATEFPPEERERPAITPRTPEEEAARAVRIRDGYYIPDVGAFDSHEGPLTGAQHAASASPDRPFHIGQPYSGEAARMIACNHCGGTAFEVGAGDCYTALRCLGCGREWCQHEG